MARDIFGNLIKTDIFGNKISKKQIKREVLEENKRKGRQAQEEYVMNATIRGVETERVPDRKGGCDYIERERDFWTGKVIRTTKVEVKSSSTAPLTEKQKKTKPKVVRQKSFWY